MLNSTEVELQSFVADFKEEFKSLPAEDVSFPRGVSDINKWNDKHTIYKKGTPIHVRGALLYNNELKKKNLDKRYEVVKNSDKIRFTYLTMPNPLNENVISYINTLPKEFDLHRYVDYDLQFDKSFIEPLKKVITLIGWNVEPVASLDSFFG